MRRPCHSLVASLLLASTLAVPSPAQETVQAAAEPRAARSPRNANYRIEVTLDPEAKTLAGHQIVSWQNIQDQPTRELWFHLYWNAWRNDRSTWMREDRYRRRSDLGDDVREGDWSYLVVDRLQLLASPKRDGDESPPQPLDLTPLMRFVAPDDDNPHDRTVMKVPLPREVGPGESVQLELDFRAKVPRTFARTGFRGDFFFVAHWYPALGVFEGERGWNCHQFHAGTEFYSDYGVYDVGITLPRDWVLGATGRLVGRRDNDDGTVSLRHVAEDVHNFAWTTSPDYVVRERRFEVEGLPPVDMRLLLQPEHVLQADRHFAATAAALEYYGRWYGPYPYGYVTIVDPAYGSGAGGMEYPTLFTAGTRLYNPKGGGSPESVTVHEAGHQFWYGIVGNNEFEHAWLDEGLNTFSTARTMDEAFGESVLVRRYLSLSGAGDAQRRSLSGFLAVPFRDVELSRAVAGNRLDSLRSDGTWDVPSTPSYQYFPRTSSSISYGKTALWLATLERYLGWPTLQRILSTFFERSRFRHPRPEELFAIANEVTGEDLGWYFDQVYRDNATFDYGVESVSSRPARGEGLMDRDGKLVFEDGGAAESEDGKEQTIYRTEVLARRYGTGRFPVEVVLVFEDGSEVHHAWDGRYTWKLFAEERPAKLHHAVVDPERILLLDLDYTNNSRLLEPEGELPARKWASKWMIWLQDMLAAFTYFV